MRPLSAILALSLAAAACGRDRPASFDDPGQEITIPVDSAFDVRLESNQSTGYRWVMVDSAGLGPLRFVSSSYESRAPERNGAGGTERWVFRGSAAGPGVITLVYKRPWESAIPKDTTRFHVTVR